MAWTPEIPPRDEIEAAFPRDVLNAASKAFQRVFWLNLPEERQDTLMQQAGDVEEQLDELLLIWNRLGDDRVQQIEALRDYHAATDKIGASSYTVGIGEFPELDEAYARERSAETALWLDYKSLFVFADILVGGYVRVSEFAWEAPECINHRDGLSRFLGSVARARADGDLPEPFCDYMEVLYEKLVAIDNVLGFYRDKFITHLPSDMFMVSSGGAIAVPLSFHMDHGHRKEVTEAELRVLRKTVRQVEQAEGLDLGSDEPDPRPKVQKLAKLLGSLEHEQSVSTVKNLLKDWGMTSPPAIEVATQLNEMLEVWANLLVEKVGLVDAD
jgi:hypothetical protein